MKYFFQKTLLGILVVGIFFGCLFWWMQKNAPETPSLQTNREFLQSLRESENLATQWFLGNFREKGIFTYIYEPERNYEPPQNNMIRQLMASRLLAEMSSIDPDLREAHGKNLEFIFRYWYRQTESNELGYIFYNNKSKLGANAMALRTLVFSPFFEEYTLQAKKLADGILSLLNQDGSFKPWFVEPEYEYDKDYILTFYSGEAILALAEYGRLPGNEDYFAAAVKAQDFYIDRYVTHLKQNYYPAYVPWHTLAMNTLYKVTGERKYAEAIFTLNDTLLQMQDTERFIGRFYNPDTPEYGSPHVASDAVYTEGLAYAYEVAKLTGDTKRQYRYLNAIKLSLQNLRSLQYTPENISDFYNREKTIGGFYARIGRKNIRIDNVQHTLDAYRKITEVLEN
jgi:hypothetical protein